MLCFYPVQWLHWSRANSGVYAKARFELPAKFKAEGAERLARKIVGFLRALYKRADNEE